LPDQADPLQLSMMAINPPTAALLLSEFMTLEPGDWVIPGSDRERSSSSRARGLAYNVLNNACDFSAYLEEQGHDPVTYPWPFPTKNTSAAVQQLASFLGRMPEQDLPPCFTALKNAGIEKDVFAFYTLRSSRACGPQSQRMILSIEDFSLWAAASRRTTSTPAHSTPSTS
jgi:hypothetical protein